MLIRKREEVTKQGFCKILWRKLGHRGSLLLEFIRSLGLLNLFTQVGGVGWALIWVWLGGGGGGRLFEAGRLLTFSAFRMGACSRWALIRCWVLIRISVYKLKGVKYLWRKLGYSKRLRYIMDNKQTKTATTRFYLNDHTSTV